jgi:hypothetical protein
MLLLIEFAVAALIVPLALLAPPLGDNLFRLIERAISRFAVHRASAVLAVLALALLARIAVLPLEPIPKPWFYDEFSYLFMADTFAHGRLTNPVHPMWQHFETFYINQLPTYSSIYYPAQGLFLAFGQKVLEHPFWGVWLSTGLMCAAFCWALQGWVPPAWAFLGGILAIIRLGTFSYWADGYWGGSVAALGGALVLGALPRIVSYQRARDAVVLAIGLAILGNSRPYESVFYATPIVVALGMAVFRSTSKDRKHYWRGVVLPASVIILLSLSAMGYYFKRCTGSALVPPYLVYLRTYAAVPEFPWQRINTGITYRHSSMAQYEFGWRVQEYDRARYHPLTHLLLRALKGGLFFSGPLLMLPWFVMGVILPYGLSIRDLGKKTAQLMNICFFSAIGMSLPLYFESHYAAPVCCALYALEIQAIRRMYIFNRHRRASGKLLVRYMIFGCVLLFGLKAFSIVLHMPTPASWFRDWESGGGQGSGRDFVESKLLQEPGEHLVIVRYNINQNSHNEWVFNNPDIDSSKIVWARDMGPQQNAELVRYFSSRKLWLLQPDMTPPRLSPYSVKQVDTTTTP